MSEDGPPWLFALSHGERLWRKKQIEKGYSPDDQLKRQLIESHRWRPDKSDA